MSKSDLIKIIQSQEPAVATAVSIDCNTENDVIANTTQHSTSLNSVLTLKSIATLLDKKLEELQQTFIDRIEYNEKVQKEIETKIYKQISLQSEKIIKLRNSISQRIKVLRTVKFKSQLATSKALYSNSWQKQESNSNKKQK